MIMEKFDEKPKFRLGGKFTHKYICDKIDEIEYRKRIEYAGIRKGLGLPKSLLEKPADDARAPSDEARQRRDTRHALLLLGEQMNPSRRK